MINFSYLPGSDALPPAPDVSTDGVTSSSVQEVIVKPVARVKRRM
jgi:hypothetical protein